MTGAKQESTQREVNGYPKALLVAFTLMMLPQLIHYYSGIRSILYAFFYILSIATILFYIRRYRISFSRGRICFLFVYLFVLLLPIISNVLLDVNIAIYDYFDIFVRLISFLVFFLLIPIGVTVTDLNVLFRGIVVIIFIACIYNMIINFSDLLNIAEITNSYSANFMSFYANRNTFAMYLFIGILSTLILLKNSLAHKNALTFVLIVEIINLFFTMSRGGILATLIVLIPSLASYFRTHRCVFILFAAAILVVVVLLINSSEIQETIIRLFVRPDAGTSGRNGLWEIGVDFISEKNLLTGAGYYTAMDYTGVEQFHSMFIDTLVDTGIFGLLFKIAIFAYIYLRIAGRSFDMELKVIFKCGLYALLFLGVFESVNIFALGSTEIMFTIMFINVPLLISESGGRALEEVNIR